MVVFITSVYTPFLYSFETAFNLHSSFYYFKGVITNDMFFADA